MIKFIYKNFSQTSRTKKFLPRKYTNHIALKDEKMDENKYYDGMDFRNTNELIIPKRDVFYPIQHPKIYSTKIQE